MAVKSKDEESFDDKPVKAHDDPILSDQEIEDIRKQARSEIEATRKKSAREQFLATEKARLLREEGLTTGIGVKDQMVRIQIILPEFAPAIVINMRPYWHNQTYTVPRHVAETLREIMQRASEHEHSVKGENLKQFYQKSRSPLISPIEGKSRARTDG